MKRSLLIILLLFTVCTIFAQTASPTVSFYDRSDSTDVVLNAGESKSTQAPLEITCDANVDCPTGYSYKLEWRIYNEEDGENDPLLTRFDDQLTYTLTKDGAFGIKLYVTFNAADGSEVDYESDEIKITIAGSKLSCPDGFSPNGDGINDKLLINCQSIVKVSGVIFSRWGQKLHTFTVDNIAKGWDGMVDGKPVKDGVYFIHLDAYGSDGIHYKIKKAINVLKGFREDSESISN